MLTMPSAGTGVASVVDGIPSLLHGRQRGRSDSFKVGGQHVIQGQCLNVIVCEGVGQRWKNQLVNEYFTPPHAAALLSPIKITNMFLFGPF